MISELEEGEASYYQNGDETTIDPDVSLPYMEVKIQDILGHLKKDFEGEVSAENLGAKFGEYGSFLPTYARFSTCSQQRTITDVIGGNIPKSPSILDPERLGARSTSSPKRNGSLSRRVKGDGRVPLNSVDTPTSNGEQKSEFPYDQRTLKVRLSVGGSNLPARKNSEIYSGLGLDGSPSPSLNDSYKDTEWLPHDIRDPSGNSPTSILKTMTSFLLQGTQLLSPLSEELICFTENEKYSRESVSKLLRKGKVNGYESRKDVLDHLPEKRTDSYENSDSLEAGEHRNQAQGEEQLCAMGGNKLESAQTHDSRNSFAPHGRDNGSHVNNVLTNNDFLATSNGPKKITNKYQEFFGDLDYEQEDNKVSSKDVSSVKKLMDSKLEENGRSLEDIRITKEKSNVRKSGELYKEEKYPRSSSLAEKHANKPHKKSSLESYYNGGDTKKSKSRKKRQSDSDSSRSSKKVKPQDVLYNDENCMTAMAVNLVEPGICLVNTSPDQMTVKDKRTIDGHLNDVNDEFTNHVTSTEITFDSLLPNHNRDDKSSSKKKKGQGEEVTPSYVGDLPHIGYQSRCNSEDNERKVKKARTSNSEGKVVITRKSTCETVQVELENVASANDKDHFTSPDSKKGVLDDILLSNGKLTGGRSRFQESCISFDKDEKNFISDKSSRVKDLLVISDRENKSTQGCNDGLDLELDMKESIELHRDVQDASNKLLSDIRSGGEISGNVRSNPLPAPVRLKNYKGAQIPLISRPPKENAVDITFSDAYGDTSKAPEQKNKSKNHNGSTPSRHLATMDKVRDHDGSAVRKDSRSQAAANAMREAKDLKRLADRLKNSGSADSTGMYFEAALKFLYGASLLESGNRENNKHNDMQCIDMYRSTAIFCEFCAHEYERSKDMVSASLAYKCMEVSYMRVIYTSNGNANRDRNEVQMALQIVPPGESPASSASDVDNLNNPVTVDKVSTSKGMTSLQVAGNTGITAKNRSSFTRLLEFAQDVSAAMDATRKSRAAFTAANLRSGDANCGDGISSVKRALEFNFQDVDGLLRLIRIAKDAINR